MSPHGKGFENLSVEFEQKEPDPSTKKVSIQGVPIKPGMVYIDIL